MTGADQNDLTCQSDAMSETRDPVDIWFDEFVATESAPALVDAWAQRIADAIETGVAEIADDASAAALMRTAVKAQWSTFLAMLTEPTGEFRLVRSAAEFASELARRQLPVDVLLRVYRTAQQETWRYATEVVRGLPPGEVDNTEVLVHFWERASGWIDASVVASIEVYQAERDRVRQSTDARRLEAVRDALEGRVTDLREFSARLGGYPVSTCHTAVVLSTDDDDAVSDLERTATALAADLGSRRPLLVVPGGRELWCWIGTRSAPELEPLRAQEAQLGKQGIRVYVGTPGDGLEGFTVSHREARAAQRIALRATPDQSLTLFPDVEVMSLVSQAPDGWPRFASRTLGELAQPGETAERLRETVHALLTLGSVEETARSLSIHKNTVRYRVGQAEEILGRPVHQAPVELALALRYHATFLASPTPPA